MMKRILAILIIVSLVAIPVGANPIDDLYGWIFGTEQQEEIQNVTESYVAPPLVENLSISDDAITLFINDNNESAMVTTSNPDLTTGTTEDVVIVRSR